MPSRQNGNTTNCDKGVKRSGGTFRNLCSCEWIALWLAVFVVSAQAQVIPLVTANGVYPNVVNVAFNGPAVYGYKIKTNIPYTDSAEMPTIIIEGYDYGGARTFGLMLNWYVYAGNFINATVSSFGGFAPPVQLAREGANVVIFLDAREYFMRFGVRAIAGGLNEPASWFSGWTAADEALSGTNTVSALYSNSFGGSVFFPGGIWNASGNVGLGTQNPAAKLEVRAAAPGLVAVFGGSPSQALYVLNGKDLAGATKPTLTTLTSSGYLSGELALGVGNLEALHIDLVGNIGIGIAPSATTKLAVNGKIAATEVVVTNAPGADYVFGPDYRLASLSEVGAFVKQNHRLPGIPSAAEMQEKGSSLAAMQAKLLEKVEELTLHLIRADERITQLADENRDLQRVLGSKGVR